jgi:integrase/recombinase XerD
MDREEGQSGNFQSPLLGRIAGPMTHSLFKTTGVQNSEGRRPRIHDLRHSFAVQALVRWYREGADVQSNLPKLAMYMGHVSIVSTAYYLHFVPALAALAGDRFEKSFGDLIEETPA